MKRLLVQLDSDKLPSLFDRIVAYDADIDVVLSYGGVALEDVRDLVHGAIFTRGGENLKNTAIFIGGSDVPTGEKMLKATQGTFFGPVRVSVMLDSNGCNTTSAALVTKILSLTGTMGPALPGTGPVPVHPGLGLLGKRALVLAGTGPVGMRVAGLLAQEGAQVGITSRKMERARSVGERLKEELGAEVTPYETATEEGLRQALEGVHILVATGAAGVQLVKRELWTANPTIEVMADVNAVPPAGIEGLEVRDDGTEREGKKCLGPLAIGSLKMRTHKECLRRLFTRSDLILDIKEVYEISKECRG